MLKIFIYDEKQDNWVEERSHLLYHDFAAFIDEDSKIIYLWNGPQCTKERLKKGSKALKNIINIYSKNSFQIINLKNQIPPYVKSRLNELLEVAKKEEEITDYQYSHFLTIRLHFLLSVICLILPVIALSILSSSLFWDSTGNNYIINAENYNNWLSFPYILILISFIFFIPQFIIAIYEYDKAIMVFSLTSIIICISLLLYLQQGIFLFQFQEMSTPDFYYISKFDIFIFLLLISSSIMLFEIPNIIKTINFAETYKKFFFK